MGLGTHAARLERWIGPDQLEWLSYSMKEWYGPPIPLVGVPGQVYAHKGGDFRGPIASIHASTLKDLMAQRFKRAVRGFTRAQMHQLNAGFAGLADFVAEMTSGKSNGLPYNKIGNVQATAATSTLWRVGPHPAAGGTAPAAPAGAALTSATTGALPFVNASSGDTLQFISGVLNHSERGTLLLYDRLFHVTKTMNSTATEAVTGVPTRYQSTTTSAQDYIGGNFLFVEVGGTALAATAHNWTVCTYTDQANAASTFPSMTGNSGAIVDRLDHPLASWFMPLEAGDSGVKALTQMQCSALVATGVINFVIGHPIAWLFGPVALASQTTSGITGESGWGMARIFDNACLAFLNHVPLTTNAPSVTGNILVCAG